MARQEPIINLMQEIWIDQCYAIREAKRANFPKDSVVVDIGAHAGVFSLWIKCHWPAIRVIALEPSPRTYPFLKKNIEDNALQDVTPIQVGCAGESGARLLYERGWDAQNTMYADHDDGGAIPKHEISVWSLDELFERMEVKSCCLLKLDCEGAEYEILYNAAAATLSKISNISMEFHVGLNGHRPDTLGQFLTAHGFSVTTLPAEKGCGYMYAQRDDLCDLT